MSGWGAPAVADAAGAPRPDAAFLRQLSHELRAPLNAMLGFAQILRLDDQHPLDPVHQAHVARIEEAGWQLLRLIEQRLDPAAGAESTISDASR
jgi:signal transduction histidine kinase